MPVGRNCSVGCTRMYWSYPGGSDTLGAAMKGVMGVIILQNYFFKASRCVQEISFQFFLYHYTCIHTYLYMHLYVHLCI